MPSDLDQSLYTLLSKAAARGAEHALPVVGMFALATSMMFLLLTLVMPVDVHWSVDGVAAACGALLIYSLSVLISMGYALSRYYDRKPMDHDEAVEVFYWRMCRVLCVLITCWIVYTGFYAVK